MIKMLENWTPKGVILFHLILLIQLRIQMLSQIHISVIPIDEHIMVNISQGVSLIAISVP